MQVVRTQTVTVTGHLVGLPAFADLTDRTALGHPRLLVGARPGESPRRTRRLPDANRPINRPTTSRAATASPIPTAPRPVARSAAPVQEESAGAFGETFGETFVRAFNTGFDMVGEYPRQPDV